MRFLQYKREHFTAVRGMLVASFRNYPAPENWLIDRLNFCGYMGRFMHGVDEAGWASGIGLWLDDAGEICAMANDEEGQGCVFFQFLRPELAAPSLIKEMFEFVESACTTPREDRGALALRIPEPRASSWAPMAAARGFVPAGWSEPMARMPLERPAGASLPAGFSFSDGRAVTPGAKARAHASAFGYSDQAVYCARAVKGFTSLPAAPDYRAELDVSIVDAFGAVTAFCTIWLDEENRLAVLEPVGTVKELQGRGLGKAVVLEALRRAEAAGALTAYVGSDQPFYMSLGFKVVMREAVWERRAPKARSG